MEAPIISPAIPEKEKVDKIGQVAPGMEVYDRLGKKVGKVDGLFSGAEDWQPDAAGVKAVPVQVATPQAVPVVEPVVVRPANKVPEFDEVLEPDDEMPRELRERLEHDGFIRIDAGFLKHHRYALRGQIDRIEVDHVVLNVTAQELLKH
jgi:hypothetical protein